MIVLAFDTATPETVVALRTHAGEHAARHRPAEGERPGHAAQLLPLATALLGDAGLTLADVDRIGVGVGPGTFTGLRIGIATARALAQGSGAELVAIPTLTAIALNAREETGHEGPLLAVLDARRGEAFALAHDPHDVPHGDAQALTPEALPQLLDTSAGPWLAAGDGALRFRDTLQTAGADVPADGSPAHRVGASELLRLASKADPQARDSLLPEYVRAPDAVKRSR